MKDKKKKFSKGFTMVELLAVIVILGILMTIGIFAVTNILNSAKKSHYNTALKTLRTAGESYYNETKSYPKAIGQKKEVNLKTLIDTKYMDAIKDPNEKDCDFEKSKVTAYKVSNSSYKYIATLVCENFDNSKEAVENNLQITFDLKKSIEEKNDSFTIESIDGIYSYRYTIYKNAEPTPIYSSNQIVANGNTSVLVKLNFKDQTNNGTNIRIVVSATDVFGNTLSKSGKVTIEDNQAPLCGKNIKNSSTTWSKNNLTVSINCLDNKTAKCTQKRFSRTFTESGRTGYIQITSSNNKTTDCPVNIYIDKKNPSCVSSGGNPNWTNGNITLLGTCTDSDSGCSNVSKPPFTTNTELTNQSPGRVCDKANNCVDCPANQTVKIDKTSPTVSSVSYTIVNASTVNVTYSASDGGGSGIKSVVLKIAGQTKTAATGSGTVTFDNIITQDKYKASATAYDNAGNVSDTLRSDEKCIAGSYRLDKRDYSVGSEVTYACRKWIVIKNHEGSVVLVRYKPLNEAEVKAAGINTSSSAYIYLGHCNEDRCLMSHCAWSKTNPDTSYCWVKGTRNKDSDPAHPNGTYGDDSNNINYKWSKSYIRKAIKYYIDHNVVLQQARDTGHLQQLSFSDEIDKYETHYIRIPLASEVNEKGSNAWRSKINNNGLAWTLTKAAGDSEVGMSAHEKDFYTVFQHGNQAARVFPVIRVKKK